MYQNYYTYELVATDLANKNKTRITVTATSLESAQTLAKAAFKENVYLRCRSITESYITSSVQKI